MSSIKEKPKLLFAIILAAVLLVSGLGSALALSNDGGNTQYTVNRYKIDGDGNKSLIDSKQYQGIAGQYITVDSNFEIYRAGNPDGIETWSDSMVNPIDSNHVYCKYDSQYAGYTYERNIPGTDFAPNGELLNVPGGGTASTYEGIIDEDGSTEFDLYYAPYNWDPDLEEATLNKVTFHTSQGTWTDDPSYNTDCDRVLFFFSEQTVTAPGKDGLYEDITLNNMELLGWTTSSMVGTMTGVSLKDYVKDGYNPVINWPGWGTTDNSYCTLAKGGCDLTDGMQKLFTKNGYSFVMPGIDVDLYAVWYPEEVELVDITINNEAIEVNEVYSLYANNMPVSEGYAFEEDTVSFYEIPIYEEGEYIVTSASDWENTIVAFTMDEETISSIKNGTLSIGELVIDEEPNKPSTESGDTTGSKITIETEATSIKVTVPTNAAFVFKSDGSNIYPSNYAITNNNGLTAITLDGIDFTGVNGWSLTNMSDTFQADQKKFALDLGLRGNTLNTVENNTVSFLGATEIKIAPESSKVLDFEAKRGVFSEPVTTENAMQMLMHFNWEQAA